MVKKTIKGIFDSIGIEVTKKKKHPTLSAENKFTMEGALKRAKERGVKANAIFDIGAAQGKWTLNAMKLWPESQYCLFEPLEERKNELSALAQKHSNLHPVFKGASNEETEIQFYVTDDLDGSGIADNGSHAQLRKVKTTSIDKQVQELKLKAPFIIKLDTHGYEVPILEGAENALKQTELVIVECYGFQIAPASLLFWEMCRYMEQKGFRLIEIVDVVNRQKDEIFWQCDAFFIPSDSPYFVSTTYL